MAIKHNVTHLASMTLVIGILSMSVMAGEALAGTCKGSDGALSNASCTTTQDCVTALGAGATCVAPEMSDYLAMAFIAITGSYMVYRTRQRQVA